ncbi:MAG: Bro-N domain-containing protein, partial [Candidatus Fonsibacter sp.]
MSKSWKFKFNNVDSNMIQCISFSGVPWFRAKDVATVLEYTNTNKAIIDHVDTADKKKLEELMGNDSLPMKYQERTSLFINETGLFSLIFRSQMQEAKLFTKWICSEVLPTIRETESYTVSDDIKRYLLIDDTPEPAQDRVKSPKGENKLHYEVVDHIKLIYKDVIISAGLGENQLTNYMRMDSSKK